MLPGPDIVIECPKCKEPARVFTLISGNTIGARRWTDGKMIAPMLPRAPEVTKCKRCGSYFWIADAKEIGKLSLWGADDEHKSNKWKSAERVRELSESECIEALSMGVARTKEQELYLRVCAWWAGNDALRHKGQSPGGQTSIVPERSHEAKMNLERLLELLNERNPDQRLMKAEVLRELGRFDEAIRVLDFRFPKEYTSVAALIRNLAQKKDPIVREIPK